MNTSSCNRCNAKLFPELSYCFYSTSPGLVYEIGPVLLCDSCALLVFDSDNLAALASGVRLSMDMTIDKSHELLTDEGRIERCKSLGLVTDDAIREALRLGQICHTDEVEGEKACVHFWNSDRPEQPSYGRRRQTAKAPPRDERKNHLEALTRKLLDDAELTVHERISLSRRLLDTADPAKEPAIVGSTSVYLAQMLLTEPFGTLSGEDNVEEAIDRLKCAVRLASDRLEPMLHAECQNLLSLAYTRRKSGSKAKNLSRAVQYAQQALRALTREEHAEEYAMAHNNLGKALLEKNNDDGNDLELALLSFHEALDAADQRRNPRIWAATNDHLAEAYLQRQSGEFEVNLDLAISHGENALRVYTKQTYAWDWAITHANLAAAYNRRSRGNAIANLESEIRHLTCAADGFESIRAQQQAATTYRNLAFAYSHRRTEDIERNLEAAIENGAIAARMYSDLGDADECTQMQKMVEFTENYLAEHRLKGETKHDSDAGSSDVQLVETDLNSSAERQATSTARGVDAAQVAKERERLDEILKLLEEGLRSKVPAEQLIPLCYDGLTLLDRRVSGDDSFNSEHPDAASMRRARILVTNSLGTLLCELGYWEIARRQYHQSLSPLAEKDPVYRKLLEQQLESIDERAPTHANMIRPFAWLGRIGSDAQNVAGISALLGDPSGIPFLFDLGPNQPNQPNQPNSPNRHLSRKLSRKRWLATAALSIPWVVAGALATGLIDPTFGDTSLFLAIFIALWIASSKLHKSIILNQWHLSSFQEQKDSTVLKDMDRASGCVPFAKLRWLFTIALCVVGFFNLSIFGSIAVSLSALAAFSILRFSLLPLYLDIQMRDEALIEIELQRQDRMMLPEEVRESHNTAERIVQEYLTSSNKFVLYLRNFEAEIVPHVLGKSGPKRQDVSSVDVRLENRLYDALRDQLPIIAVVNPEMKESYLGEIPKILIPKEDWEVVLSDLIQAAHLIVFAISKASLGLSIEAELILQNDRTNRTVVIMQDEASAGLIANLFYEEGVSGQDKRGLSAIRAESIDFQNITEQEPFSRFLAT